MNCKKLFLTVALVTLPSLSNTAFSDSADTIEDTVNTIEEGDKRNGFYASGHWNIDGSVIGNKDAGSVGIWQGKENAPDLGKDSTGHVKNKIRNVKGWDENGNFGDYKPIHGRLCG